MGELIVYWSSRRRLSVHISNIYICKTSRPNATKFYLKHHLGEGKASLGFGPDWIRTVVSMETDSSHIAIMGKTASSRFSQMFLIGSFSYLQIKITCMRAWMSSKFCRIRPRTTELVALEGMKKIP